jgi:hypothetical protein
VELCLPERLYPKITFQITSLYSKNLLIICHTNAGITSDHYITHVQNHANANRWHCLNDQLKTNEFFAEAVDDRNKYGRSKYTHYMLGFTKIQDSAQDKRAATETTTKVSKGTDSGGKSSKGNNFTDSGSKKNGSNGNASKDNNSTDATPKSHPRTTDRSSQTSDMGNATLTTSLFPIGGGDEAFETLTRNIKLDFNVGVRDHIPIEVRLALPGGR